MSIIKVANAGKVPETPAFHYKQKFLLQASI